MFIKAIFLTIFLIFIVNTKSFANEEANVDSCVVEPTGNQQNSSGSTQRGGRYRTAEGTMNVLFIYAQFSDDGYNVSNSEWPKDSPPVFMDLTVDETWTGNPTPGSLTDYFAQMSMNKLKFVGKEVFVTAPHSRQWYLDNGKRRGDIHREIIEELDQAWDFGQFDNWDYNTVYSHTNSADGVVDMVFFIWRNVSKELSNPDSIKDKLNLENYASIGGSTVYVDNNQRRFEGSFGGNYGSGVTVINGYSQSTSFRLAVHEFAHYLQGYNPEHTGFAFWGMLSAWGTRSYAANAFERHRLGWIDVIEVDNSSQTLQNITLGDFVTTGQAYRIEVDAANDEYFYLENHQALSMWDTPDKDGGTGLFVIRQHGPKGSDLDIVPADGRFQWSVAEFIPNPWGSGNLPVWQKGAIDMVNGYADTDRIPYVENGVNKKIQINFYKDEDGNTVEKPLYLGDTRDAFNVGYREVFSPWSNINSHDYSRAATGIGFEIVNESAGTFTMNIHVNTAQDAKPSLPRNFAIQSVQGFSGENPKLTWDASIEPDLAGYKIERKINNGSWTLVYTASPSTTSWIDYSVTRDKSINYDNAYYRMYAYDNDSKVSIYTGTLSYWFNSNSGFKRDRPGIDIIGVTGPADFSLVQNHPNPFNPSTSITYGLPERSMVELKVYDVSGREVAVLQSGVMDAGFYSVIFNAGNISSGIYVYRLSARGQKSGKVFNRVKRMLLVK